MNILVPLIFCVLKVNGEVKEECEILLKGKKYCGRRYKSCTKTRKCFDWEEIG